MNAATARRNSTIADTRWRLAAGSEKPAANSAGETVAPRPMPVGSEPTSVVPCSPADGGLAGGAPPWPGAVLGAHFRLLVSPSQSDRAMPSLSTSEAPSYTRIGLAWR